MLFQINAFEESPTDSEGLSTTDENYSPNSASESTSSDDASGDSKISIQIPFSMKSKKHLSASKMFDFEESDREESNISKEIDRIIDRIMPVENMDKGTY